MLTDYGQVLDAMLGVGDRCRVNRSPGLGDRGVQGFDAARFTEILLHGQNLRAGRPKLP